MIRESSPVFEQGPLSVGGRRAHPVELAPRFCLVGEDRLCLAAEMLVERQASDERVRKTRARFELARAGQVEGRVVRIRWRFGPDRGRGVGNRERREAWTGTLATSCLEARIPRQEANRDRSRPLTWRLYWPLILNGGGTF